MKLLSNEFKFKIRAGIVDRGSSHVRCGARNALRHRALARPTGIEPVFPP